MKKRRLLWAVPLGVGLLALLVYYVTVPAMVQSQTREVAFDRAVQGSDQYRGADFCQACHPQYYQQWQASLHAKAYTEAHFAIRASELSWGMPEERCLSCHSPLAAQGMPKGEGVSCEVCHGPGMTRAVVRDVCVRCHGMGGSNPTTTILSTPMEFETSAAKSAGLACSDCHLPKQEQTSFHGFQGSRVAPETYKGVVHVESVERRGNRIVVVVRNTVMGHALPTGAPENVIFLEVVGFDGQGQSVYTSEYRFEKSVFEFRTMPMWVTGDTRLKDGELRQIPFDVPASVVRASASLKIKPRLWNGEFAEFAIDQMVASFK